jgi:hypothetical protein
MTVSASSTQVSMTSKRFRSDLEALQFPIGNEIKKEARAASGSS